ncbi:MAG: hemolysin III family protein [Pirellulales bacterium]|nr:hemolysin III family protein [Pirellulales bacterium]
MKLAPCQTIEAPLAIEDSPTEPTAIEIALTTFNRAELANSITHGLGLLLSLVATPFLLMAARRGNSWQMAACVVYSVSMIAVYAASTCSHWFCKPKLRHFFRVVDQGCIYLFIAGTTMPIAATFLHGGYWWLLIVAIWTVALGGFISKVWMIHRIDSASAILPLLLSWMPLLSGPELFQVLPSALLWWMLAGGICYMVGIFFLTYDYRHDFMHSVWHLLVIAGTAFHFFAIWRYAMPLA